MSKERELLECPFCGGDADLHESDDFWYVACRLCINQTTHFHNGKDVVIERWNTRCVLAARYERLQKAAGDLATEHHAANVAEMEAEIGRLRAALEHYATPTMSTCCQPSYLHNCQENRCWMVNYEGDDDGWMVAQNALKDK